MNRDAYYDTRYFSRKNAPKNYPEYPGSRYYAAFRLDPSNLKVEIIYQETP